RFKGSELSEPLNRLNCYRKVEISVQPHPSAKMCSFFATSLGAVFVALCCFAIAAARDIICRNQEGWFLGGSVW
ncbi:hypothetical protein, partial [Cupriavidus sp. TA19]|uniref:hypothetical protein n=1 Tax=Cupriavidus sp. TA19 TaxID=701108 RepID=UPI00295E34D4